MVPQTSRCGFERSDLGNPWDYKNGMGAKRFVSALSFLLFSKMSSISIFTKLWKIKSFFD
jgi:hypothetical protein